MSGDVQPKKRKDKKRRKDEGGDNVSLHAHTPLISNANDDVNIHVHKEGGTGGGICAKVVFFILFSALIVLIGLIIKENQGLSDLDAIESETRYSQIFEGWVDKSPIHQEEHDDHDETFEHEDEELDLSEGDESEEVENENEEASEETAEDDDDIEDDDTEEKSDEIEDEVDESEPQESEEIDESEVRASEEDDEDEGEKELKSEEKEDDDEEEEQEDEEEDLEENEEEENLEKLHVDDSGEEENDNDEAEDMVDESELVSVEHKLAVGKDQEDKIADQKVSSEVKDPINEDVAGKQSGDVNVRADGESDSDKQSDIAEQDEFANITNKEDYKIKEQLNEGQKVLKNNAAYANKIFDAILQKFPSSPRCLYGKATALDILAEQRKSNELLQEAISFYLKVLTAEDVPDALFVATAERCINRMRFIGHYRKAILIHQQLIKQFPENPKYQNDLAATYLTVNMVPEARAILKKVLYKWPDDGFALVHYGFVLKTTDMNLTKAVTYMRRGLQTKAPGVIDGRFYFHLGDALARLGKMNEAMRVYEEGVRENLFLSKYQRSLYNLPRLTGKPWWQKNELPYLDLIRALERNWKLIRNEGLAALNDKGYFQDESENLRDTGNWKQLELFARGQKHILNCKKCPITCNVIESVPDASGCKRGQTKFSVMHPGTHVWPHCGPTNCRLRIHLGLKVPAHTAIRVAEETRRWKQGEVIIFDDSFEHEVWHNGTGIRLVLIVDVWHPEVTPAEKRALSPI